MDLSSAVSWWEELQLRVLVLGSQSVQWLLFLTAPRRKSAISGFFRVLVWLAYLGSDAFAIYALAALFNRHKKQEGSLANGKSILEVVWAPVLLMHLGGQDCITAYNMEDNELWRRHVLTAVSQITVSIYVFCRSWPGGDKKLLQASIMLFTIGVIRCIEKPLSLKSASINSLVGSSDTSARTYKDNKGNSSSDTNSLKEYVDKVRALFQAEHPTEAQGEGDVEANHLPDQAQGEGDVEANHLPDHAQGEGDVEANHLPDQVQGEGDGSNDEPDHLLSLDQGIDQVNKLFVDLASPYHDRLHVTESFLALDENESYACLQERLAHTFDLLYTKKKVAPPRKGTILHRRTIRVSGGNVGFTIKWFRILALYFRISCLILPLAAIGLFHRSHREAYNDKDVKVTYTLLCCTAVLEYFSFGRNHKRNSGSMCGLVSQYSFVGFFARNEKYTTRMSILSCLKCKDYVDQHWCMQPSNSSGRITILVLGYVKRWWKQHIRNAADYTRFNNLRGQWSIQQMGCSKGLGWSIKRPFDESVLLWHIATDLCFYIKGATPNHQARNATVLYKIMSIIAEFAASCIICLVHVVGDPEFLWTRAETPCISAAGWCREISNYMMYLMFAKPDMLMVGTRRNLFTASYGQLKDIPEDQEQLQQPVMGREIAPRIIAKVEESPEGGSFVHEACTLAKALMAIGDEKEMWDMIQGVWVEMLCFSASRCRGYLHAKSLGSGGELLTFVWLLWSHMGMETLAERMQETDVEFPGEDGEGEGDASASHLGNRLIGAGISMAGAIVEDDEDEVYSYSFCSLLFLLVFTVDRCHARHRRCLMQFAAVASVWRHWRESTVPVFTPTRNLVFLVTSYLFRSSLKLIGQCVLLVCCCSPLQSTASSFIVMF